MPRSLLPLAALVAAAALTVAACGGEGGGTTTTATTPPTATTPAPPPPPPPPPPKPEVRTVTVAVRDGKVVGGLVRATLEKGDKVALVVRSDAAERVHLHGYDVAADVAPGKPARLVFVASLPGRFEVELENRGLAIADLEVRP